MKTTNRIFLFIGLVLFLSTTVTIAQDQSKRPEYVSITTMHWNMDQENFDMDAWKSVEKEFLSKVTKKNEHIMGASFYLHQFTADNTELIYVQTYKDWDAIDKASERDNELSKEAWPDKNVRTAYYKKRNAYYSDVHSDEIYATMSGAKLMTKDPGKDMTLYFRKSHFAFPDGGTNDEFKTLRKEYLENVVHKNEYIKGYYPAAHAWGADKTDFIEGFIVESLADIDKMFDRNTELLKSHWPDENVRKEIGKKSGKYFTGIHSDYIYTYLSGLSK